MPFQVDRTATGTQTIPQTTQHSGITKTTKIERSGFGLRLPDDSKAILGLRATTS